MSEVERLLDELERVIAATPKKNDSDYVPLINALDAVLDEIKSGQPIDHVLERSIAVLRHIFSFPKWNLIQSSIYGIAAAFQNAKKPIDGLLPDNLHVLLERLADDKREVRDATAQCLGVLSAKLGEKLMHECKPAIERATKQNDSWQTLEGFMIACGYIACRASDMLPASFGFLCDVLVRHTSFTSIPGYSNYVRLQSLKGLERLVRLGSLGKLWIGTEHEASFRQVALDRMDDENIDVRKFAARLHNAILMKALGSTDQAIVQREIHVLLDRLSAASRWEQRHGLCTALSLICQRHTLIGSLSAEYQSTLAAALSAQVKSPLVSSDPNQSASTIGSANAAAAVALTDLFLSQCQLEATSVDALSSAMASLSVSLKFSSAGSGSASSRFAEQVLPQLVHLLSSSEATLLDAGGQSVFRLVGNTYAAPAVKDHLGPLQCLIFKNKYHSSLPIRDSAIKNWKAVTTQLGSEAEALAHLTPALVDFLLSECEVVNTDVRESVFKAFEEVVGQASYPPKLREGPMAEKIFRALCKGALNTTGKLPDYPRAAASAALSKFLSCGASQLRDQEQLTKAIRSELAKTLVQVLGADTENIVIEGLKCVASTIRHWETELGNDSMSLLVTPLICLAFSSYENVRFTAMPVMISFFNGPVEKAMKAKESLFTAFASGLKARFSFSEEDNPEEESREGLARAILYVATLPGIEKVAAFKQHGHKLLSAAIQGVLIELSRDSATVQANCMAAIVHVLPAAKDAGFLSKCNTLLKKLAGFVVAAATGKGEDFEYDPDAEEDEDEDGDADEDEDGDASDEEVQLADLVPEKLYLLLVQSCVASALASAAGIDSASKRLTSIFTSLEKKGCEAAIAQALHMSLGVLGSTHSHRPQAHTFDFASWNSATVDAKLSSLRNLKPHGSDAENSVVSQAVVKCITSESCKCHWTPGCVLRSNALLALERLASASSVGPTIKAIADNLLVDNLEEDADNAAALKGSIECLSLAGQFSPFAVVAIALDAIERIAKAFPPETAKAVAGMSVLVQEANEEESEDLQVGHVMVLERLVSAGSPAPNGLLENVLAIIARVQSEDDAPETYSALCSLAAVLIKQTPADQLSEGTLEMFASKLCMKWFMSIRDGAAAVALLRACVPLMVQFKSSRAFSSVVQSLADVLANEDIGSVKADLLELIEILPSLGVRFLPPPTPIDQARVNEGFSKKA